jgi:excinuclease ABC subunit B
MFTPVLWKKMMQFQLVSTYSASPGQKDAITKLVDGFKRKKKQTLLGITGSGKTFVMANLIERLQKPTLIIAHNKTLAAQLYAELKEFFPNNRVEFFISFYDYYQPESYIPTTDMYIEKDSSVNEQIEKMRMHAISSLLSRKDTIVIASISCIYNLGNPEDYKSMSIKLAVGKQIKRQKLINTLVDMQYERNDMAPEAGRFRVRGNVIDVIPAYEKNILRIELEGNRIRKIKEVDLLTGDVNISVDQITLYPAKQYVVPEEKINRALEQIKNDLEKRLTELPALEAQRLKQRTNYDLEMIKELGYCKGIENYSKYFDGRESGEPPFVLLDYFPDDYLMIIDESHQTIPQSRAMYNGNYQRKKNLIDYGFRLPSAFDNRPLTFEEFEAKMGTTLFVSATPGDYEFEKSGAPVELITRPTGLLDPIITLHPIENQIQHLMSEAKKTIERGDKILITTLTKRLAEDLTDYLVKEGLRARYLHSEIDSLDRIELIRQLRIGEYDILVGINLLREGLDLPEVSTIFILDADKEGFLRDERSLIQTIGRAARNVNGHVMLYADVKTKSIERAMQVTHYRRMFQIQYNKKHGIKPTTIVKSVSTKKRRIKGTKHLAKSEIKKRIIALDAEMRAAAERLDFESAIEYRDTIEEMKQALVD